MDQHALALIDGEADIAECGFRPGRPTAVLMSDAAQLQHRRTATRDGGDRLCGRCGMCDHDHIVERFAEIDCPGGDFGLAVVMGDVNKRHGTPGGKPGENSQQRIPTALIDHAGDLVGDQQRRLSGQCRSHGQPLQLPAGQAAGVAFLHSSQTNLAEESAHIGASPRRQPPHHVVGDPGAQDLTLGMLHDDRGATQAPQTDRSRPVDDPRRRLSPTQQQHQRGLSGPVGAGDRDVLAGLDRQVYRPQGVMVGAPIAVARLVEANGQRCDRSGLGQRLEFVHVGDDG